MQNWACILFHILFVSHRFYLIFCCGLFDRNAASFLIGRTCGVVPPFTGFYWVLLERTIQLRCFFFYRVFASSVATALLFSGVLPLFTAAGCAAITANHTLLFSLSLSLSQFFSLVLGRVAASYLSIVS